MNTNDWLSSRPCAEALTESTTATASLSSSATTCGQLTPGAADFRNSASSSVSCFWAAASAMALSSSSASACAFASASPRSPPVLPQPQLRLHLLHLLLLLLLLFTTTGIPAPQKARPCSGRVCRWRYQCDHGRWRCCCCMDVAAINGDAAGDRTRPAKSPACPEVCISSSFSADAFWPSSSAMRRRAISSSLDSQQLFSLSVSRSNRIRSGALFRRRRIGNALLCIAKFDLNLRFSICARCLFLQHACFSACHTTFL